MLNKQETPESFLLSLIEGAIHENNLDKQRFVIGEVIQKISTLLAIEGKYIPSFSVHFSVSPLEFSGAIAIIKDKPNYMQVLDPFSAELVEKLEKNKKWKSPIFVLLEFIQGLVEKKSIKNINLPLIKRIIFILDKVALQKKLSLLDETNQVATITCILDAVLSCMKEQEEEMHVHIKNALEFICDSEDFKVVLKHQYPENKSGAYLYIIVLLAFNEKFKEDKEIRKIGFEKLFYSIKRGEGKALNLLWTPEGGITTFLQQIKGEEFELLAANLNELIMAQWVDLPIRQNVLFVVMNICMQEREFSRQQLLIQSLIKLFMVGREFYPLTERDAAEKTKTHSNGLQENKKQFLEVWQQTDGNSIVARLTAVLQFESLAMLDPDPATNYLIQKLSKIDSQDAAKIVSAIVGCLAESNFNKVASQFLLDKIYFILQKLADIPTKDLLVQTAGFL